jgi:predicted RNA-binding Zn-ribbon protein involved in translation (DUF1610 family)
MLPKFKIVRWVCPRCAQQVIFTNETARRLAQTAGGCQSCRANDTLLKVSSVAAVAIMDFFGRTGWPKGGIS